MSSAGLLALFGRRTLYCISAPRNCTIRQTTLDLDTESCLPA